MEALFFVPVYLVFSGTYLSGKVFVYIQFCFLLSPSQYKNSSQSFCLCIDRGYLKNNLIIENHRQRKGICIQFLLTYSADDTVHQFFIRPFPFCSCYILQPSDLKALRQINGQWYVVYSQNLFYGSNMCIYFFPCKWC